jgi:hypothetical protein
MLGLILSPYAVSHALLGLYCQRVQFFSWIVKADHPRSVRVRNAAYDGAYKMVSRGISLQMLTFFSLQMLHPFICRSANTLFRKRKRLAVIFHKVLNRLSYFYDTWWYLDFCQVHTTAFINTDSFFVQVTKWTDSSNALHAVYFKLNIWNGLGNGWHKPKRVAVYLVRNKRVPIYITGE